MDLLMERMRAAGFNFSQLRALSACAQVCRLDAHLAHLAHLTHLTHSVPVIEHISLADNTSARPRNPLRPLCVCRCTAASTGRRAPRGCSHRSTRARHCSLNSRFDPLLEPRPLFSHSIPSPSKLPSQLIHRLPVEVIPHSVDRTDPGLQYR